MIEYLHILLAGHKAKMDERGASAVEYGLLIAGIAAAVIAALVILTPAIKTMFTDTATSIGSNT